ncbi:hypothetical protein BG005_011835 [Podila minutissima]|nr:hypothetical protein BG005_011835 [Podila minutissima]
MLRFVAGRSKAVNLDFNVWDHSMPEIYGIILGMFVKLGLVECLNITTGELLDFIIDVDRGYLATFYHSFYHAADVTAVLFHMLLDMNASQYLSKPDMAALLLAGLCHDIGHPGLNNLFQVNAKTELVKQHGETSVLEKYSCSLAMDLVSKHALFRNVEKSPEATLPEGVRATEASMRQSMVKAIMATDMSFHYDMLNNLNSLIEFTSTPACTPSNSDVETESESENGETDSDVPSSPHPKMCSHSSTSTTLTDLVDMRANRARFEIATHRRQSSTSSTNSDCSEVSISSDDSTQTSPSMDSRLPDLTPELRQNLMNCLLHAADISNAVKPWTLCKRWSDLVVQEFFRQGDIEKAQDLPVSPNMDRDQHNQPQISLGFGDFVVQPYFESFCEFLPEASPFLTNLISNRAQWQALQTASQQSSCAGSSLPAPVGPADDRRPSSPLPAHLGTGRRVSVAAGVLILDDTRPQRALGKSTLAQEAIVSVLRREAAQAGKDAAVTSNLPNPTVAQEVQDPNSGLKSNVGASLPKYTENDTLSTRYRRRHGSLQLECHPSIRQEYGDGYITLNDQDRDIGWDHGNIPTNTPLTPPEPKASVATAATTTTTTSDPTVDDKETDGLPAITLFHTGQSRPVPYPTQSNSSRSSTPAVMMGNGRYDWGQNVLFGSKGGRDRSGCGPLDSCVDDTRHPASERGILVSEKVASIHDGPGPVSKDTNAPSPTVEVAESSDGTLGYVVGTTKPSPPMAMKPQHTVAISAATESTH